MTTGPGRKRHWRRGAAGWSLLVVAVQLPAAPLPDPLTLEDALQLAGDNHPSLALSRAALAEAEAAGALSPGQSATVEVDGQTYPAKVVQIGAEADASGRYELTVSFDPGDAALRAGLPASIDTGR